MSRAQVKTAADSEGSLIHRPTSHFQRLNLAELFPETRPVEVELGCGDGSFLAGWAALLPDRNFIGVERLLGRIRKLDRKGRRTGLRNLSLLRIEAAYFVEWMLPAESISALHVYFPDPWPKRKHRKNRLINTRFTALASRVLQPGGVIYLRTDDADYFAQMQDVFRENARFAASSTPPALLEIQTDFERDFRAQGIGTLNAAYRFLS
jgi:tRNA (guanine-N7-)-methyltransferase